MSSLSELKIDLRQMILALETTVDLVGMNDTHHGKRVGFIASQLARLIGFSEEDIQFAFELGLLHDCGVSTEQMHNNLVSYFDWKDAYIHCDIGYHLLKNFQPLAPFAIPILYHHTAWKNLAQLPISDHDAQMANLIFVADRVDILAASHYDSDILLARKEIMDSIDHYRGSYFNPNFVEALETIAYSEAFWIALEARHVTRFTWDMGLFQNKTTLNIYQLKQLSMIMAYIVDQKSPFTAQHSARVGFLAKYLAQTYGLSQDQCDKIEIAGFLHDIGKLRMPDSILDKAGPLNEVERSIMNQHSYETYEILRHIEGLEDIAIWAAYHHEDISRTGYPFHPEAEKFTIEARIIVVADVFQALVQDRPYRQGMPLDDVIEILEQFVTSGKLDRDIVDLTKKHRDHCFSIAQGKEEAVLEGKMPFFMPQISH